ncbi:hypothetical protein [Synechococcus sp. RS9916]|uniref:hypothetical protein n=1 Tax=Synechococcus sp. RS9916 TaxID=221359 RepID=UPI0000E539B7|nr:hypothetical protein [Synechococcus sp. RS9916]EAU74181.1 hypothetical protein RS9916_31777 [Synechococcus sp. RS9916]
MKRILFYAAFAFSVTGCAAITNLTGPGIDPDFSTDWKKVDPKTLEDYKESGGKYSLFTKMNEVGTWSSGTKAVFIQPSDCNWFVYNNGATSLTCNFMAELKDIRGTRHCIGVEGRKDTDGDLTYKMGSASCRWKDEINT